MNWKPHDYQQFLLKEICSALDIRPPIVTEKAVFYALLHLGFWATPQTEEQKQQQREKNKKFNFTFPTSVKLVASTFNVPPIQDYSEKSLANFLVLALTNWSPPNWHKVVEYWESAVNYLNLSEMSNFELAKVNFGNSPEAWRAAPPPSNKLQSPPHYRSGSTGWWILFGVNPTNPSDRNKYNWTVFLAVPLAMDDALQFIPPKDGMLPRIHRDWLEPPNPYAEKNRYLGSMDGLQQFFESHPVVEDWEWSEYWRFVEELVKTLTGSTIELIHHSAGEDASELRVDIVCYGGNKVAKRFIGCLKAAVEGKAPLLKHIAAPTTPPAPLLYSLRDLLLPRQQHLGHMDTYDAKKMSRNGFPLEESQRLAVNHMNAVQENGLLAVNGPPGTGKTSFLRSVIATEWVKGALNGSAGSLIIATAATNKAVTNIIESFAEIPGPEMEPAWTSRWLPELPSYGWFFPAQSYEEGKFKDYMTLKRPFVKEKGPKPPLNLLGNAESFSKIIATGTDFLKAEYLSLHARCVGLEHPLACVADAAYHIQQTLQMSVNVMRRVQSDLVSLIEDHKLLQDDFSKEEARQGEIQEIEEKLSEQCASNALLEADLKQRTLLLDQMKETWDAYLKEKAAARRQKAMADVAERLRIFFDTSVAPSMSDNWWIRIKTALFGNKEDRDQARNIRLRIDRVGQMADPEPIMPVETQSLRAEIQELGSAIKNSKRIIKRLQDQRRDLIALTVPLTEFRERVTNFSDWLTGLSTQPISDLIDDVLALKNMKPKIQGEALALRFEEWLDQSYRFQHFHMAARYWEARWLDTQLHTSLNSNADQLANLRHMAMLSPVVVATVYTVPNIIYREFSYADLMIFDEAGQASPEIGCPAFAIAKRAIVVGDVDQLEPIWNLPTVDDHRMLLDVGLPTLDTGFRAANGSVMAVAQRGTAFGPPALHKKAGVALKAHYRCRSNIIGYCKELIYKDDLIPSRIEQPDDKFPYPPMTWVAVDGPGPSRDGGSWRNDAQINEIVGWLADDADRLKAHYEKDLPEIVALIAPFRAQALAIKDAVAKHPKLGPDIAKRMVINTVHALQGAEKPVVAFTLTQHAAPYFVNGYGDPKPNLLNVAISRAKDAFILFADPNSLKPTDGAEGKKPFGVLAKYMAQNGQRLYPRELVFIESSQKKDHIVKALGRRAKVIATGGHFTEVADWPEGKAPTWVDGDSPFISELKEVLKDAGQLDQFVLATDDDRDGEEIAWHILRSLHAESEWLVKRTVRMRFHALDVDTLRLAREHAMPGVDIRRVQSSLLKRLADYRFQQKIERTTGKRIGRNQIVTLRWIAEKSTPDPLRFRVVVNGHIGAQLVSAYPVPNQATTAKSPWMSAEDAQSLRLRLDGVQIATFLEHKSVLREYPYFPPNTTDRVFISGWRRYGWRPSETAMHLQNVYWGRFSTAIRNGDKV